MYALTMALPEYSIATLLNVNRDFFSCYSHPDVVFLCLENGVNKSWDTHKWWFYPWPLKSECRSVLWQDTELQIGPDGHSFGGVSVHVNGYHS